MHDSYHAKMRICFSGTDTHGSSRSKSTRRSLQQKHEINPYARILCLLSVHQMYDNASVSKKQKLWSPGCPPDEECHVFFRNVETNNVYQVRSRLKAPEGNLRLVTTAEQRYGNTPLHRAVSLGFVEMSRLLVEAGADVDAVNVMGDAPIHCCWRFWEGECCKYYAWKKNPYLMTTPKQMDEFEHMVSTRCNENSRVVGG